MSGWAIAGALFSLVLARILRWGFTRKWRGTSLTIADLRFPALCPVCLSPDAESVLEEESDSRTTKNWIVARKIEWLSARIRYCDKCAKRVERMKLLALVAGAISAIAALLLMPPTEATLAIVCYVLYGYPAWLLLSTIPKGIILTHANARWVKVRVRNSGYAAGLEAINRSAF